MYLLLMIMLGMFGALNHYVSLLALCFISYHVATLALVFIYLEFP